MQAFFNRLRPQISSQRHSESSPSTNADAPSSSTTGAGTPAQPEVVTTETPAAPFTGLRKIAPNQDALLASSPGQDSQQPAAGSRRAGANELGVRVPSALARVANRKVTPTKLPTEDTIRESSEIDGPQPIGSTQAPEDISNSRKSFGLSSLTPFTSAQTWSTFGRSRKDKQEANNASDDKPGGLVPTPVSRASSQSRTRGGVTVSRTSSKSTPNRTHSTKSGGLSRSNSTKQPVPSHTEHQHSRTLSTSNENNDSPPNTGGGSSPTQEQKGLTPSTASTNPPSIFKPAPTTTTTTNIPHEPIDATYPPRSTAAKKEEQPTASSLPFTFGRQPPARPPVEDVFISEFGTSDPTEEKDSPTTDKRGSSAEWMSKAASTFGGSPKAARERERLSLSTENPSIGSHTNQPFPLLETPISENSVGRGPDTSRPHHTSSSSTGPPGSVFGDHAENHPQVPSLVSDRSNVALHSQISSSSGLGTDIPLRNMASFASSGDEIPGPQIATSSWVNSSTSNSRFEFGAHTQETTLVDEAAERTRSASGSSSGRVFIRRTSSAKRLNSLQAKKKSMGSLPTNIPPITVFPATTTVSSQAFPRQGIPPIITTSTSDQTSSQQANEGGEGASSAEAAGSGSGSPRIEPPALAVTAPTPRPSPARSTSNRLSDLFLAPRVPHGHAHASGIGVAGVETRSRQQSIKVMGKRKAGDAEAEDDTLTYDDRSRRPRFDSNAPSSYHRKRMKLSNASEIDASPLRTPRRTSMSGAPSIRSLASSRPGTATRGGFSRNASSVSMPVSAILTPRAPSVHRPLSIASRSSAPHYNNPLRNRVQRRSRREEWIDSWTLDREEMPIQAWLFLAGFLFPPCWWIAVLIPIERQEETEKESKLEKGKGKDIEEDGKRRIRSASASDSAFWAGERTARLARERMWRFRCLMASIISTIIYVPIIVCAAVFAHK